MTIASSTTAKVITPAGRGAIAVIQVEGPKAIGAISDCFQSDYQPFANSAIGKIRFGRWEVASGEELVVVRTDTEQAEIHCHGGTAASEAILRSLATRGVELVGATDHRCDDKHSPLAADALQAVMSAPTEQVAACLLDQAEGALEKAINAILRSIDQAEISSAILQIDELLAWKRLGQVLTEPWRVVLAGPPNVGKSSLVNALVGYDRAIVYDQPGTTRDVVTTTTAINRWPIQLSDTAGLRETDEPIEAAGVELTRQMLLSANLVLVVIEASKVDSEESIEFIEDLKKELPVDTLMLNIASKADLARENLAGQMLATSTVDGQGIAELLAAIGKTLVPTNAPIGKAIPFRAWHLGRLTSAKQSLSLGNAHDAVAELQSLLAGHTS